MKGNDMNDTLPRTLEIIADQCCIQIERLTESTRLDDLGDSLDMVECIMELEEEFDILIPDDVAEEVQTIGQAVAAIDRIRSELE